MKNKSFRVIISLITVIALISSIAIVTNRFLDKNLGMSYQFKGYYAQEPNTVDVLFVGSSRVHSNIDPAALWENYGITSYALGLNAQPLDTTYYSIKEALKTQNPKVIVVEVSQDERLDQDRSSIPAVYGMHFGINYMQAVTEKNTFKSAMENLLVFPMYHSRYDLIDKDVYVHDSFDCYPVTKAAGYKGAIEHLYSVSFPDYTDEYVHEGELFSPKSEQYLDRIVKLCADRNIELMLTLTPAAYKFDHICITDYINRHPDVAYLNCSDYYEEMGINSQTDFIDAGHCNVYGSMKTGKFLGSYLKEKYDLPDHRGDSKYYSWEENCIYQKQKIINNELNSVTGFGTYFDYFPNDNYICVVALLNKYDSEFIGQEYSLSRLGCSSEVYNLGGLWITDGTDLLYAAFGYEGNGYVPQVADNLILGYSSDVVGEGAKRIDANWHQDIGNRTLEVINENNNLKLMVDSKDYAVYKNYGKDLCTSGIEILVYDKLSEEVVDCVCFDADNGWAATRNDTN